jgi:hypothetical protein
MWSASVPEVRRPGGGLRKSPGPAAAIGPGRDTGMMYPWTRRAPARGLLQYLQIFMVLHCKWFMFRMTLDMPDEGTR